MKVEIKCPLCGRKNDIDSNLIGQTVTCDCGDKFVAQLPPAKLQPIAAAQPIAAPETAETSLPDAAEEVTINGRIQIGFWIVILAIVLLIVWYVVWKPKLPKPPVTASIVSYARWTGHSGFRSASFTLTMPF